MLSQISGNAFFRWITGTAIALCVLWSACDKGLAPTGKSTGLIDFPVPPEGGNPVGIWEPDTLEPVYIELLDMEVIEDLVDSLHLESDIEGYFSFHVSETCSINAVLTVQPYVYLKGLPTPLVLEFVDTLKALGTYSVLDETVLILPMESGTFNLDTLGISQSGNRLELISLSNHFPYEGFTDVRYYMILKFNRLPETSQEALPALSRWRRKFRG